MPNFVTCTFFVLVVITRLKQALNDFWFAHVPKIISSISIEMLFDTFPALTNSFYVVGGALHVYDVNWKHDLLDVNISLMLYIFSHLSTSWESFDAKFGI